MALDDIESKLQRLRDASERIGANLLELELDPERRLLDEAPLEGQSAEAWSAASVLLMQLWQWHGLLDAHLERIAKLRGTRSHLRPDQLAGLKELLEGETIELSQTRVPLEERDLLEGSQLTVRCNPDGLLSRMTIAFEDVKAVVARFASAWVTLEPRVRSAAVLLAETSTLAESLGEAQPAESETIRSRLARLEEACSRDPLSVRVAEVEEIEALLRRLGTELGELAGVRAEIDQRLADARCLLRQVLEAQQESELAHEQAVTKIVGVPVSEPMRVPVEVAAQLDQVAALADAGAWRQAGGALREWTDQVNSLLAEARRITAQNRGLIIERNELRGRLDAFRAKASILGLLEDPQLSRAFGHAHEALYTAPTDLGEAGRLVRRYQRGLLDRSPPGGVRA